MKFDVIRIDKENWKSLSSEAHRICFGEERSPQMDRIDFALMAVGVVGEFAGVTCAYCTVRELDSQSIYLQFGGAFPPIKDSVNVWTAYNKFIEWFKLRGYSNLSTLVENDNIVYLKMAMKAGLRIIGTRCFKGQVVCELYLDLTKE